MKIAKDLHLGMTLPHASNKKAPQQDTNRIMPYWHFASDWFAVFV
ncbi:MAG: hypothetical protein ACREA5_00230 [Nitrosotalea sp.]